MYEEPKAMREIHEIRERMHEEQKGLSDKEIIKKIREEAEEVKRKYGLKLKKHAVTRSL
jgi:hypothetical protein